MSDTPEYPGTNSIAGNHATPPSENVKMGIDAQNTLTNSNTQSPDAQAQPDSPEALTGQVLATDPAAAVPTDSQADLAAGTDAGAAPASTAAQPAGYGGNFGNDVQNSYHDQNRRDNQQADANRGAFGEQGSLGNTHGGYGNQYREFDTATERPAAEANEEKYYGDGASRPGPQHNSYQQYDGQDTRPAEQGHAVVDTPAVPARHFGPDAPRPGGDTQDTRNLPSKAGPDAAFQNDNGAPTVGAAYAADYGHTSGAGLPPGTPGNHLPAGPDGHAERPGESAARGTYDGTTPGNAPTTAGAPAPVNAPDAPQGAGYGYGDGKNEQAPAGNPDTGDARNGFGSGGSKEGSTSAGYGSKGGSYDDHNPGAQTPAYDDFTKQDKAQNYGQENRPDFRPADGDKPQNADYGPAPRRNDGRDEAAE